MTTRLRRSSSHRAARRSGGLHDVRKETVGGFAGPVGPGAPVGSYGNVRRRRRQGRGTYAGDADRQRQGTFADSDPAG